MANTWDPFGTAAGAPKETWEAFAEQADSKSDTKSQLGAWESFDAPFKAEAGQERSETTRVRSALQSAVGAADDWADWDAFGEGDFFGAAAASAPAAAPAEALRERITYTPALLEELTAILAPLETDAAQAEAISRFLTDKDLKKATGEHDEARTNLALALCDVNPGVVAKGFSSFSITDGDRKERIIAKLVMKMESEYLSVIDLLPIPKSVDTKFAILRLIRPIATRHEEYIALAKKLKLSNEIALHVALKLSDVNPMLVIEHMDLFSEIDAEVALEIAETLLYTDLKAFQAFVTTFTPPLLESHRDHPICQIHLAAIEADTEDPAVIVERLRIFEKPEEAQVIFIEKLLPIHVFRTPTANVLLRLQLRKSTSYLKLATLLMGTFHTHAPEIAQFYLQASLYCESPRERLYYQKLLAMYHPDIFIEHASRFPGLEPADKKRLALLIASSGSLEELFSIARIFGISEEDMDAITATHENREFIKLVYPAVREAEIDGAFTWEKFCLEAPRLIASDEARFMIFQRITADRGVVAASPLFMQLEIRTPRFIEALGRDLLMASPLQMHLIFSHPSLREFLPSLAATWIEDDALSNALIIGSFPFDLIDDETVRMELILTLAKVEPLMILESMQDLPLPVDEMQRSPLLKILIAVAPDKVVEKVEKLGLSSREHIEMLVDLILASGGTKLHEMLPTLQADTRENIILFLRELFLVRAGDEKNGLINFIFHEASTEDLEMLFSTLPTTGAATKAKKCFVVCVYARHVRGTKDAAWEIHAAQSHRIFKDTKHSAACIQYLHQVEACKASFTAGDINKMLNQTFYAGEKASERLELLIALMELRTGELLVRDPMPIAAFHSIVEVRAVELLGISAAEQEEILAAAKVSFDDDTLTFKGLVKRTFLSWRKPLTVFLYMVKIDTLEPTLRDRTRVAAHAFIKAYLMGNYIRWRKDSSPHLQAMRERELLAPPFESWWQEGSYTQPLSHYFGGDAKYAGFTVEVSRDPCDFFLSGEECGSCQRFSNAGSFVLPLLGLMDGSFAMVLIRDPRTKKITSRSFVRLLSDHEGAKPVVLLENNYGSRGDSRYPTVLRDHAREFVKRAPTATRAVVSKYFTKAYNMGENPPKYPNTLHAEGCFAPSVYADSYGYEKTHGHGGVKTDGHYTLEDVVILQ